MLAPKTLVTRCTVHLPVCPAPNLTTAQSAGREVHCASACLSGPKPNRRNQYAGSQGALCICLSVWAPNLTDAPNTLVTRYNVRLAVCLGPKPDRRTQYTGHKVHCASACLSGPQTRRTHPIHWSPGTMYALLSVWTQPCLLFMYPYACTSYGRTLGPSRGERPACISSPFGRLGSTALSYQTSSSTAPRF